MHDCPLMAPDKKGGFLSEPWHLDKKVPIALIVTLLLQAAGAVWWVSTKDAEDRHRDQRISGIELAIVKAGDTQDTINDRLTRIEERSAATNATLERIEAILSGDVRPMSRVKR
ncbi:MAG: hypothetical protein IPI58_00055 [Alphaproteobacteria bacterium]|nr:MAG: hypothetical protein IPI58_00055 [Alphaproteobacteria bacterium]